MNKYKKLILFIWISLGVGVLAIFLMFYAIRIDANGLFGGLPSTKSLEKPDPDLSSELFSADGVSLGKYFRHNRTEVAYNDLSQELIDALLVTEDIRFTQHSGIDLRGLGRVLFQTILMGNRNAGGGSTLTQQVAKNLFKTRDLGGKWSDVPGLGIFIIKMKEWIVSVQLESSYTKEEILAMYLNTIEYGNNTYGIKVAAQTYFNKLPSELNHKESAVLVGLINKPTRYNPIRNPEFAMEKRTEILYNLLKYGKIDRVAFDSLKVSDFGLQYKVQDQNEGLATYFRTVMRNYLMNWAEKNDYDLFADGLKIYTTIDSRMQLYAEQAVAEEMDTLQSVFIEHLNGDAPWIDTDGNEILDFVDNAIKRTPNYRELAEKYGEGSDSLKYWLNYPKKMTVFSWGGEIDTTFSLIDSLKYYKHFLQAGFMAMDPRSGHIKAWVGGIDHKYFKFDHVRQSKRQVGSTFKPFVYAAAIESGYSPCFTAVDAPVTWVMDDGTTWTPQNANGKYTGETMTIRRAMAASVNSVTARIMQKIRVDNVVEVAKRLGIESRLAAVPALCLGVADVSLYEMVGAYSTFVNQGIWTQPFFITRIEDKNGVVVQDFIPKRTEAFRDTHAYLMLHMLKGAMEERGGSAHALDYRLKENNEIGAKTGTTQNASDGWYMGVTHDLVAGAWVGGDDRSIHFKHWALGQGGKTARPIWENFMLKVYDDPRTGVEKGYFKKPSSPLGVELDCDLYEGKTDGLDTLDLDLGFGDLDL